MTARRILFSAQKNEGPFLLEWVAFHRVVGFTDIVVVSNDCDDGSDALLDALHAAGAVHHLRQTVAPGAVPQTEAAALARDAGLFAPGDWVMWLDLDEFFFIPHGDHTLDALFESVGAFDLMAVAWRFFGDGGNATWPGRHISPAFTHAQRFASVRHPQVKTLFRHGPKIAGLDIHRPLFSPLASAENYRCIGSNGGPVDPQFFDRRRKRPFNRLPDVSAPYRHGMILHFSIRTPDMFARKARRGDGYFAADADPVLRDSAFYDRKNMNHTRERAHLALEPATVAEMLRLLDLPQVRNAADAIDGFRWMPLGHPCPPDTA